MSEKSPPHRRESADGVGIPRVSEACTRRALKTSASSSTAGGGWVVSGVAWNLLYGLGMSEERPESVSEVSGTGVGRKKKKNG